MDAFLHLPGLTHSSKCDGNAFLSVFRCAVCKWKSCIHSVVTNSLRPLGLYSLPSCSVHGILQARILEWVTVLFSRRSSWPRDQTQVSCNEGGFITHSATRETQGGHEQSRGNKVSPLLGVLFWGFSSRDSRAERGVKLFTSFFWYLYFFCFFKSKQIKQIKCMPSNTTKKEKLRSVRLK